MLVLFVGRSSCPVFQSTSEICQQTAFAEQAEFGDMYTERNVAISGIHTHSGPGGYLQYVLYDITSLGFVKQSWEAVMSGIVEVSQPSHVSSDIVRASGQQALS